MNAATLTIGARHEAIVITPPTRRYSVRRYYDSSTGQFLSVDPVVDQTEAPYAYASGDPVDLLDPNGLGVRSWFENNVVQPVVGGTETFAGAWWDGAQQFGSAWWEGITNHPVCVAEAVLGGTAAAGLLLVTPEIVFGAAEDGAAEDAFAEAAAGGRNAGFLENYLGKSAGELQRGVNSFQRQIDEHLAKIADPGQAISDWASRSAQEQAGLLGKWANDLRRLSAQQSILQDLLNGRVP